MYEFSLALDENNEICAFMKEEDIFFLQKKIPMIAEKEANRTSALVAVRSQ